MSVFDGLKFRRVYSPIHNFDPRIKFIYVFAIFVAAILFGEILPLIALFLLQIPFVLLAGVQREWLRSLRGALFLGYVYPAHQCSLQVDKRRLRFPNHRLGILGCHDTSLCSSR